MDSIVGIRELKAKLSHHLDRVRSGARLTVTDRGRAIATINPVDQPVVIARLLAMVDDGFATWSGGKPTGAHRRAAVKERCLVSDAVLEDRG